MKKIIILLTILTLVGCSNNQEKSRNIFYMDTYINVKIYTDNGYDKSEIPWQLIGAQTKNILQEHEVWSYLTLQYILYYMYEVLELNLFSEESNGSILSLLPFYGIEAEKYFNQTKEIEKSIDEFDFNDNEIVIKKSCGGKKKKYIDIGGLK